MKIAHPGDDLQAIFDSAAQNSVVHLAEGVYRQKITIRTPGLVIEGEGMHKTVIEFDDYAKKLDEKGVEYNTFRTWTVAVCADNVTMRDLAVVNSALFPEEKGQEVALTVYGDNFSMSGCRLSSTQDTLFLGPLPRDLIERYKNFLPDELREDRRCRQRITASLIEGTVDFIFGCGDAEFLNCEIRSVWDKRGIGYVAAPAHELEQEYGFVFKNCRLTRSEGVADGSIYLARPWRDYGISKFVDCEIGPHISPLGYDKWNDTERDKTARFFETNPPAGRVRWVRAIT